MVNFQRQFLEEYTPTNLQQTAAPPIDNIRSILPGITYQVYRTRESSAAIACHVRREAVLCVLFHLESYNPCHLGVTNVNSSEYYPRVCVPLLLVS